MSRRAAIATMTAGLLLGALAAAPCRAQVAPADSLVGLLASRLHITQNQAWRGVGALLALAESRLNSQDFEIVAGAIPNSQAMLDGARMQGVVTRPIDDDDEFHHVLDQLRITGMAQDRFAPGVQAWLRHVGAYEASDLLGQALD